MFIGPFFIKVRAYKVNTSKRPKNRQKDKRTMFRSFWNTYRTPSKKIQTVALYIYRLLYSLPWWQFDSLCKPAYLDKLKAMRDKSTPFCQFPWMRYQEHNLEEGRKAVPPPGNLIVQSVSVIKGWTQKHFLEIVQEQE